MIGFFLIPERKIDKKICIRPEKKQKNGKLFFFSLPFSAFM